jgi:hypothetical protein
MDNLDALRRSESGDDAREQLANVRAWRNGN